MEMNDELEDIHQPFNNLGFETRILEITPSQIQLIEG